MAFARISFFFFINTPKTMTVEGTLRTADNGSQPGEFKGYTTIYYLAPHNLCNERIRDITANEEFQRLPQGYDDL